MWRGTEYCKTYINAHFGVHVAQRSRSSGRTSVKFRGPRTSVSTHPQQHRVCARCAAARESGGAASGVHQGAADAALATHTGLRCKGHEVQQECCGGERGDLPGAIERRAKAHDVGAADVDAFEPLDQAEELA